MNVAPTVVHFVSLPAPRGGRRPPWGGPAPAWAPTLSHFVWSLPPKGAQPAFGRPGGGLTSSFYAG